MLCISTLVGLSGDDPELVRARALLVARLKVVGEDDAEAAYLASTPFREDDGAIVYLHVFRVRIGEAMHPVGIPAAPGWWPSPEQSLAPRRTGPRAQLRLVS